MRYKRRGVDKNGNVANYVETEQFIHVHNHTLSFVQTRGSVPVFWSQVGYRYNPRPRLDKGKCTWGDLGPCWAALMGQVTGVLWVLCILDLYYEIGNASPWCTTTQYTEPPVTCLYGRLYCLECGS